MLFSDCKADGRLPKHQQRGYRHVFDALGRMMREEGFASLYKGLLPNVQRAMLMTMGQLASYDEIKPRLLSYSNGVLKDNLLTHGIASTFAGGIATILTQPVDVVKTRVMMAEPGRYRGMMHCMGETVRNESMLALFKGTVPSFTRLGPHTVLTFVFLEQLRALYAKKS
jgi:dicarboxylate transporter 10